MACYKYSYIAGITAGLVACKKNSVASACIETHLFLIVFSITIQRHKSVCIGTQALIYSAPNYKPCVNYLSWLCLDKRMPRSKWPSFTAQQVFVKRLTTFPDAKYRAVMQHELGCDVYWTAKRRMLLRAVFETKTHSISWYKGENHKAYDILDA